MHAERREGRSFYDYGCIFVLSYGITRDERGYHPTFYSGMVAKAAADLLRSGKAPRIVIESGNIFPGVALNDGDLVRDLMIKFGVPKDAITIRPNHKNTYEQIEDMEKIRGRYKDVLTLCAGYHEHRVRTLLKKHGVKSHVTTIEDVLRKRWKRNGIWNREVQSGTNQGDSLSRFLDDIETSPDFVKTEALEDIMTMISRFDRKDILAKTVSNITFPIKGTDIVDVRHRRHVRRFATSDQKGKKPDRLIIVPPLGHTPVLPGSAVVEDPKH